MGQYHKNSNNNNKMKDSNRMNNSNKNSSSRDNKSNRLSIINKRMYNKFLVYHIKIQF